jgi:hypothetical protein
MLVRSDFVAKPLGLGVLYFQWKIFNLLEAGSLLNVDLMFK